MSDSVKKWYEMKEEGWWTKNPRQTKNSTLTPVCVGIRL